jgi:NAD(P)-dependent dehydrogenase (short-subunit alcohol dehydrogenase family)
MTKLRVALAVGTLLAARSLIRRRRRIDLRDKIVVVTGGSRGLGLVIARELVRDGAIVAICARDPDELERARVELSVLGGRVHAGVCDVTDRDDVTRFIGEVRDELGPIDVLINNAGVIQVGPVETMTTEDYALAMQTHVWGALYTIQAVLPDMKRRRAGRIVNIASIGGKLPVPHLVPYCTSKFALVGMSQSLRTELAKDGIHVTTVCPGLMRTGSPRHAFVKGHHEAEYAWFDIMDSLPLTSMNAERAARKILHACRYGDAEVVVSAQAKLAVYVNALAPSLVQDVLGAVARVLPSSTTKRAVQGKDAESALAPSVLTALGDAAARRNNEM